MSPPDSRDLPGGGAGLGDMFPNLRDEETKTRCPACPSLSPKDPAKGGIGICIVCHGTARVTREELDGTYATIDCPACINGQCSVCKGTGFVSATRASRWRRGER